MKIRNAEPFPHLFEADKADLVRLQGALGQLLDSNHGSKLPPDIIELREDIEAAIRATAIRLVYRIDRIRDSAGFEAYLGHARTTRTIMRQLVPQMKPDSTDRFIVLLLEHHMETLLERQSPLLTKKLPHKNAA